MSGGGKLLTDAPLAPYTWLRVGGPADRLFLPNTEAELSAFLADMPADEPLSVIGIGSNLLVRDGGIRGTVIRLGSGFGTIEVEGCRVRAGAAALDASVAKAAGRAGITGLEFYRGIPGSIGGALRMNAGAYGGETKDVLVEATVLDRRGNRHLMTAEEMGFSYRRSSLPPDWIVVSAVFEGQEGDPARIEARMADIMAKREATQPIKSRTGGSTFKNPDPSRSEGRSSWQLIDAIGARGRVVGDAQMSDLHANFMINRGAATAADLEALGEGIRRDVKDRFGVELEWEIKRVGDPQ
ncbi:UDP-N-acetylenolpyruvoylglucosamine reductase [Parvularcula bermudensis HTCC2503]|uniref:UDP-N-acetylenolpyruvoylglucosamine reductase n=1 Tax=Parvularcula bermudensis (strain ATCC BAA-594 / HTCC2503 / KCTC 12087) TaxID=314260 RepID=E0TDT3_PARBH|nr:UDP-N-acetylmuramate dehydrogenase [Parvularcula bermudensis]ADM09999.1 UDP-N-acetylenolpyruvoylglucosamine reductase [Parvularcula bermudensis HTCC2503]